MKVYDPQIYPRKLCVLESIEELSLFEGREGEVLETSSDKTVDASVWTCMRKEDKSFCVVVYFHSATIENIAHESVHIANSICQDCSVDFNYSLDEHYAYLVGWIAGKIAEAEELKITKKKKR